MSRASFKIPTGGKPLPSDRVPLLPGEVGWTSRFTRGVVKKGWQLSFSHYPSLIRIFAEHDPENFPVLPESDMMAAMDDLWASPRRRALKVQDPEDFKGGPKAVLEYLHANPRVRDTWVRHSGKARAQFNKSREMMEAFLDGGRLTPWEIANMRIPDSLSCDSQVVHMQASCQGMTTVIAKTFSNDPGIKSSNYPEICRAEYLLGGLEKLISDPWFRFALAAPEMEVFGVDYGAGFTPSFRRTTYLKSNPYQATTGELEAIRRSPAFKSAWTVTCKNLGKSKGSRLPPLPSSLYYPNRRGRTRYQDLKDWCFFKPSKQRPGGY